MGSRDRGGCGGGREKCGCWGEDFEEEEVNSGHYLIKERSGPD